MGKQSDTGNPINGLHHGEAPLQPDFRVLGLPMPEWSWSCRNCASWGCHPSTTSLPYHTIQSTGITMTLLHGDSLLILPTLPANSVDCICTDPPYSSGGMMRFILPYVKFIICILGSLLRRYRQILSVICGTIPTVILQIRRQRIWMNVDVWVARVDC